MKGFLIPGLFAAAVMGMALLFSPRCTESSPHGPRIASVMLIAGCE